MTLSAERHGTRLPQVCVVLSAPCARRSASQHPFYKAAKQAQCWLAGCGLPVSMADEPDGAAEVSSPRHSPADRHRRHLVFEIWPVTQSTDVDPHCNYLDHTERAQLPPRSCLMKTTISFFSTVPELSLSNVEKTSSNASSENSSPDPRLPRVSWTNFLVSSLSRAPDLSTS